MASKCYILIISDREQVQSLPEDLTLIELFDSLVMVQEEVTGEKKTAEERRSRRKIYGRFQWMDNRSEGLSVLLCHCLPLPIIAH
jgi:hypothetical protein